MELKIDTEAERYEVLDGKRHLVFEGWELGAATSRTMTSDRWIDMKLYRTEGGTYVLSKVGCSDVFHSSDCRRPSKGVRHETLEDALSEEDSGYDPADIFLPCRECKPAFLQSPVWVETDMHSAPTFSSVELLFDALHQRKSGVKSLSRVSRALLDQAQQRDPALAKLLTDPVEIQ